MVPSPRLYKLAAAAGRTHGFASSTRILSHAIRGASASRRPGRARSSQPAPLISSIPCRLSLRSRELESTSASHSHVSAQDVPPPRWLRASTRPARLWIEYRCPASFRASRRTVTVSMVNSPDHALALPFAFSSTARTDRHAQSSTSSAQIAFREAMHYAYAPRRSIE
ncbi:hypothetical protein EVG20_g7324 [Dentipellis fragilis]|uniref:Uncharacterized protein n=1 Tax=Dentipellis fragilis TaxID=205917 RepID=A0A4Y9YDU4_9AGAM|nr:hypothetical protein EVG20_g7324 [Dentipellis fragilis]